MKDFLKSQFDKLLLSFFLVLFTAVVLFLFKHGADTKVLDWAANAFSSFMGALLGLITGVAIGRATASKDGDNEKT